MPHTDCYVDLVRRLVQDKKIEEARKWVHKGYAATIEKYPGIASKLEEMLREMALSEKNFSLATAYAAFEFFEHPGLEKYLQLEKISIMAGVWEGVRNHLMVYLEKGVRPKGVTWPVPPLELQIRDRTSRWNRFPDTETLIDIAIKEKCHEDALKWYNSRKKTGSFGSDYTGEKVAHAVWKSHPDEALSIWKALVAHEISQAKPKAYQVAGGYLKKMRAVYNHINKPDAWTRYKSELRENNKRRPRMLNVLNSLEGRRTRIVP